MIRELGIFPTSAYCTTNIAINALAQEPLTTN